MSPTTAIRVQLATHARLRRLAELRGATVAETVDRAVRLLAQDVISEQLRAPLSPIETGWLEAELQ